MNSLIVNINKLVGQKLWGCWYNRYDMTLPVMLFGQIDNQLLISLWMDWKRIYTQTVLTCLLT